MALFSELIFRRLALGRTFLFAGRLSRGTPAAFDHGGVAIVGSFSKLPLARAFTFSRSIGHDRHVTSASWTLCRPQISAQVSQRFFFSIAVVGTSRYVPSCRTADPETPHSCGSGCVVLTSDFSSPTHVSAVIAMYLQLLRPTPAASYHHCHR
jgi:hypothetical protein